MEYGCIGKKLAHSFSKEIHSLLADYKYELKELTEEELDAFMRRHDFKAINVTIPYKEKVIPYLYSISPEALRIGAVNTIVNDNGRLYGYNTDFAGMKKLIEKQNISLDSKKVLILGTGGTSRTAYAVAESMGASFAVKVSRSKGNGAVTYREAYSEMSDADVIINTTPVGMYPDNFSSPIDLSAFCNLSGVIDAVYNPIRSKLVSDAKKMGITASGGLYMLVAQAFYACEKFLGRKLDETLIDKIFKKILSEKENIVLIGMPGCGKTTIGKIIAEKTGKRFIDLDDKIEKDEGMKPSEIIGRFGEAVFREKEKKAAEEVSALTGCVIATGGGTVIDGENTARLKQNGRIIFINRDIKNIIPTKDRPLSDDYEKLAERYRERYPIYTSAADLRIEAGNDANENADKIIKEVFYENSCN